jgi:hypothetical protein
MTADSETFWLRFDRADPDACWPWVGWFSEDGYGRLIVDGQRWIASRYAYTLAVGPIPEGLLVCHRCDNPPCCNPKHLFLGTNGDNLRDAYRKGRRLPRVMVGEANPRARVTRKEVRLIRASGERPADLARRYGISRSTVSNIRAGRTWKDEA